MNIIKTIKTFSPTDLITLFYIIITGLLIICFPGRVDAPVAHLIFRVGIVAFIIVLKYLDNRSRLPFVHFCYLFYPLLLFSFLYSETDALNNIFSQNMDPWFSDLDFQIFHCQPAILFSQLIPNRIFSEVMHFSYFSYYLLIFLLCLKFYLDKNEALEYSIFIISASFLLYYITFILIPVAGPQFYYSFPDNQIPEGYLFDKIMQMIHHIGERPTAAFPSSHVGIVIIIWYLSAKYDKKLLWYFLPVGILLCFSTVYLKAHYLIDVFGGIVSAFVFLGISHWGYKQFINGTICQCANKMDKI
jgi:membrane-associated phospholipid phosphatase